MTPRSAYDAHNHKKSLFPTEEAYGERCAFSITAFLEML
jgi:hypothetical protein